MLHTNLHFPQRKLFEGGHILSFHLFTANKVRRSIFRTNMMRYSSGGARVSSIPPPVFTFFPVRPELLFGPGIYFSDGRRSVWFYIWSLIELLAGRECEGKEGRSECPVISETHAPLHLLLKHRPLIALHTRNTAG